jgi:hypothetical protein
MNEQKLKQIFQDNAEYTGYNIASLTESKFIEVAMGLLATKKEKDYSDIDADDEPEPKKQDNDTTCMTFFT